jgi:RimJ/RimL family protein N-acetyltransferase
LEKAGFKAEGTIRKLGFVRGEWRDKILYDILIKEWKEPRAESLRQSKLIRRFVN